MKSQFTRRRFLQIAGAAAAAVSLESCAAPAVRTSSALTPRKSGRRNRVLRIAHLTDVHIMVGKEAPQGFAQCLRHVHSLKDRPDVIFTGGDCVIDTLAATEERARTLWGLWTTAFAENCTLPVHSVLGNHDIWGWNKTKSQTTGNEPLYGKEWAKKIFGVKSHYRSFDLGGWHIIFLDSSTYDGGTYYLAKLDDEQFAWLKKEIESVDAKTPILIVSHIPILSAAVFYDGDNAKDDWVVPRAWMHIDSGRIKDLFIGRPNVRLCLSGHVHLRDRVVYNDVTYLCGGGVACGVWDGGYHQCRPGYTVLDLYDDGSFEDQYLDFAWVCVNERGKPTATPLTRERMSAG